ncbi:glycosyltransferase family 1 protein [Cellulomonas sp. NTE-D12]|uniref:glycosyltransferase family 4 protein n=1 Tax=Cellulomonas sp. NTE-D12 TaxID=2962632 RepID=UPI0030812B7D|nr:hypothetical protein CELD12_23440 [Cellulomonas sp. NTE-D12]
MSAPLTRLIQGVARRHRPPTVPRDEWRSRVDTLLRVLEPDVPLSGDATAHRQRLVAVLDRSGTAETWLALAVLSGRLPTASDVVVARRRSQLEGSAAVLSAAHTLATPASARRHVEVVVGRTLVDMGDLVLYPLGTGIQRVAREVGRAWRTRPEALAVGWTSEMDGLVPLDDAARDAALNLAPRPEVVRGGQPRRTRERVVVPWRGTYVLPELAIQPRRCASLQALAEHSPTSCGVIGFDCVPLTSPETSARGFAAVFALNLAAVAHFDRVVAISDAAATEYRGWTRMLGGAGLPGPEVMPLALPEHAPQASDQDLERARRRFVVADLPLVLCVGSHEPRKNHLAVLHAAELLWRKGLRFSLTFVGGNSWNSEDFRATLKRLIGEGRPVESVSRLDDAMLWAAYRLARCTVFPSLNEGFGLPVAESLSAGTPAITSRFGSMAEIGGGGGALLVDPRDDGDLAAALERLLVDDELHGRLTAEARERPATGWEQYADELWRLVHEDGTLA